MGRRTDLALEIFQPDPDGRPGNCAEAIYRAFEPLETARPDDERAYRRLAKGRAPGGACGAYHAGAEILARRRPDLLADFESAFRDRTGCTSCRSIRKHRQAGCRDCVATTAEYLEGVFPVDLRTRMPPAFAKLEGGLFSSVSKADVGEGAGALIERGVDIMAWADPFFPDPSIPDRVKRVMIDAIAEGTPSHYSMPIGRRELREAIAGKVSRQTGRTIDPGRNVIVTPGSDTGLLYAMMPFVTAGAEILCPEPSYPNNFLDPELLGGVTVPVPLFASDGYQLRVEELERRLTSATRMVVLCQPNNPTTTVFRRESLEALARFVIEHDLVLVCDQAFEDHIYDGIEFVAPATLPGMWERTLTVCSVSKGLGLSGFRVGYIYGDDPIMDVLYGGAVNVLGTAATVTSIGATAALRDEELVADIGATLDRRRRIVHETLGPVPGVSMRMPESGILAWLDVSALGTSAEVTSYLLDEAGVLVNPGAQYGEHGEGFIRLVFAVFADEDRARDAYTRIAAALTRRARLKGVA